MKRHTWVTEVVDCGHVGWNEFTTCTECGATGGPENPRPPWGSSRLPDDCDEAAAEIELYRKGQHPTQLWHREEQDTRILGEHNAGWTDQELLKDICDNLSTEDLKRLLEDIATDPKYQIEKNKF